MTETSETRTLEELLILDYNERFTLFLKNATPEEIREVAVLSKAVNDEDSYNRCVVELRDRFIENTLADIADTDTTAA